MWLFKLKLINIKQNFKFHSSATLATFQVLNSLLWPLDSGDRPWKKCCEIPLQSACLGGSQHLKIMRFNTEIPFSGCY